jgi:hypothetical protein
MSDTIAPLSGIMPFERLRCDAYSQPASTKSPDLALSLGSYRSLNYDKRALILSRDVPMPVAWILTEAPRLVYT